MMVKYMNNSLHILCKINKSVSRINFLVIMFYFKLFFPSIGIEYDTLRYVHQTFCFSLII